MKKVVQYLSTTERELAIQENSDLHLIEERNVTDGNFLIFSDLPIDKEIIYINVPESEFTTLSDYVLDVDLRLIMVELGL